MSYYHVWFTTKYRKTILEDDIERKTKDSFLEVAHNKKYNILEMETNKDHAHLLLEAKNKEDLAGMIRTLKCVSAKKVLEDTPHLRVGNARNSGPQKHEGYHRRKPVEAQGSFWARRYGLEEVSKNQIENIKAYIQNQKKSILVGG